MAWQPSPLLRGFEQGADGEDTWNDLAPEGARGPLALDPQAQALARQFYAIRDGLASGGEQRPIWNPNNRVGEETLQSMSNPDPSFRPGVFVGGGTVPVSREYLDAFGRGSQEAYDQLSLIGGMGRGGQAFPGTGSVTLASRRPLANPPPSRAVPEATPQPPPDYIVYHGSPHLFPPTERNPLGEFDPAKIGTGEGAQAYGVGAGYLAEREGIAKGYRDTLAPQTISREGVPFVEKDLDRAFARKVEEVTGSARLADNISVNVSQALKTGRLGELEASLKDATNLTPEARRGWETALAHAREFNVERAPGHMYEVNVHADPEHFLHWDKPLSEQSQFVRDALNKLPQDVRDNLAGASRAALENPGGTASRKVATGEQFYKDLSDAHSRMSGDPTLYETPQGKIVAASAKGAADALHAAGIPGIRYLDAGSRSAGEGTHNLVVFSPETMEIIRRYGLAGLLGGGAAAMARPRDDTQ